MESKKPITDILHSMPADLNIALNSNKPALERWESLTPLAQN